MVLGFQGWDAKFCVNEGWERIPQRFEWHTWRLQGQRSSLSMWEPRFRCVPRAVVPNFPQTGTLKAVPHVWWLSTIRWFCLLLHHYSLATIVNGNVNIGSTGYLIYNPQRCHGSQVENRCPRAHPAPRMFSTNILSARILICYCRGSEAWWDPWISLLLLRQLKRENRRWDVNGKLFHGLKDISGFLKIFLTCMHRRLQPPA